MATSFYPVELMIMQALRGNHNENEWINIIRPYIMKLQSQSSEWKPPTLELSLAIATTILGSKEQNLNCLAFCVSRHWKMIGGPWWIIQVEILRFAAVDVIRDEFERRPIDESSIVESLRREIHYLFLKVLPNCAEHKFLEQKITLMRKDFFYLMTEISGATSADKMEVIFSNFAAMHSEKLFIAWFLKWAQRTMRKHITLIANKRLFAFPAHFDKSYNLIDVSNDWGVRGRIQNNSIACHENDREVSKQNETLHVFNADHGDNARDSLTGLFVDEINCWPFSPSNLHFNNSSNSTNCSTKGKASSKSAHKSTGFHSRRKRFNRNHERVICRSFNALACEMRPLDSLNAEKSCSKGVKGTSNSHDNVNRDIQENLMICAPQMSTKNYQKALNTSCCSSDTCPDNEYDKQRCTMSLEPLFNSIVNKIVPSSITPCESPSTNIKLAPISLMNLPKYTLEDKENSESIYFLSCAKSADGKLLDSTFSEKYSTSGIVGKENKTSFVDNSFMQDDITCDQVNISSQYPEDKSEPILSWKKILPAKFSNVAMTQSKFDLKQYGAKIKELSPMTLSPKSNSIL